MIRTVLLLIEKKCGKRISFPKTSKSVMSKFLRDTSEIMAFYKKSENSNKNCHGIFKENYHNL